MNPGDLRIVSRGHEARKYRVYTRKDLGSIPQLSGLSPERRLAMEAVSAVLPFRVNNYVVDELIDWSDIPNDPIFQLTFPQPGMLAPAEFERMAALVREQADPQQLKEAAREIQFRLNPHPADQRELNVPSLDGEEQQGMQHKYRETVLFFPAAGQTCHAYCTYCFRWAQFVGIDDLKFANRQAEGLQRYVTQHPEISSVLFTGGDPLIMKTAVLRRFIDPLLDPSLSHVESIRLGTKAPGYWPQRFVTDADADDLLRLFERVVASGRNLALMAHFSHPRELETPIAQLAIRRIRRTGAVVRCQAPLIRHVNDSAECWAEMWRRQVRLGCVPYYMFVERNTGPKEYFHVPLARAHTLFRDAYSTVSGLGRTVRGPSMSASPGKVVVDGECTIQGERVFALKFLQARNPEWVGRPFFARYDEKAAWLDDLRPAFGEREFFFESEFRRMKEDRLVFADA
ncbi:MAG: lysine 2,3-aminomutase [bacterium]|nr:lysine 2,3-aminomutase [bacterium]